jgi:Ca2+-binding EF-hand superfamily protein
LCRIYDKEGNGYITTDVLREIISEIDPTLTPEVQKLFILVKYFFLIALL